MKRILHSYSNQFPISVKPKAASHTLSYNGINIQTAMNCTYAICKTTRDKMVAAGTHQFNRFKITPNF